MATFILRGFVTQGDYARYLSRPAQGAGHKIIPIASGKTPDFSLREIQQTYRFKARVTCIDRERDIRSPNFGDICVFIDADMEGKKKLQAELPQGFKLTDDGCLTYMYTAPMHRRNARTRTARNSRAFVDRFGVDFLSKDAKPSATIYLHEDDIDCTYALDWGGEVELPDGTLTNIDILDHSDMFEIKAVLGRLGHFRVTDTRPVGYWRPNSHFYLDHAEKWRHPLDLVKANGFTARRPVTVSAGGKIVKRRPAALLLGHGSDNALFKALNLGEARKHNKDPEEAETPVISTRHRKIVLTEDAPVTGRTPGDMCEFPTSYTITIPPRRNRKNGNIDAELVIPYLDYDRTAGSFTKHTSKHFDDEFPALKESYALAKPWDTPSDKFVFQRSEVGFHGIFLMNLTAMLTDSLKVLPSFGTDRLWLAYCIPFFQSHDSLDPMERLENSYIPRDYEAIVRGTYGLADFLNKARVSLRKSLQVAKDSGIDVMHGIGLSVVSMDGVRVPSGHAVRSWGTWGGLKVAPYEADHPNADACVKHRACKLVHIGFSSIRTGMFRVLPPGVRSREVLPMVSDTGLPTRLKRRLEL